MENLVENVKNSWGEKVLSGGRQVMGNFTQQHFCKICVKPREEDGNGTSFGGTLEGRRRVCYNKSVNFTADTAFGGT